MFCQTRDWAKHKHSCSEFPKGGIEKVDIPLDAARTAQFDKWTDILQNVVDAFDAAETGQARKAALSLLLGV